MSLRINDYAGAAEQLRLAYEVAERADDPTVRDHADTYRADLAMGTRDFATAHRLYVVLKGYRTIIATPEGAVFVNPTARLSDVAGFTDELIRLAQEG